MTNLIYQIYYDDESKSHLDEDLVPYENSLSDDYFENSVILKLYNKKVDCDYIGVTSWRLKEKTLFSGKDLLSIVTGDKDVYIYSPNYDIRTHKKGKKVVVDSKNPGLWYRSKQFDSHLYTLACLLNNEGVLPFGMFNKEWVSCWCNFWVARKSVFDEYCETTLKPAMDFFNREDIRKKTKDMRFIYRGKRYSVYTFVLEGLLGTFLANKNYSYKHVTPPIEMMKQVNLSRSVKKKGKKFEVMIDGVKLDFTVDKEGKLVLNGKKVKQLSPIPERKTVGFWHVCMINDYLSVTKEQLSMIVDSGLYDKVDSISVGCVGNESELVFLKELFKPYDKISIVSHSKSIKSYEFGTLNYIYKKAKSEEFFCFYIHSKGVSYPGNQAGKHWRDYMNFYNITRWRECTNKLREGYETCGVKLVTSLDFPMHYSGNFWWSNSDYIKTLKHPSKEKVDRYSAEMWLCSNKPLAVSLCQKFVDYNTVGNFTPTHMINRTIVHTLAFNLTSEVEEATKQLHEQNKDLTHIIVDLGFPLQHVDEVPEDIEAAKALNSEKLKEIASTYGSEYVVVKNEGVSQNWEAVRQLTKAGDDSVLICADPDERTFNAGWVKAIRDVINEDPTIAWCSLAMKEQEYLYEKGIKKTIGGHTVYVFDTLFNWAQGGFSGKFLNDIEGVQVPNGAPIYGWIEHACFDKMIKLGYRWVVLADYYVEHTECSTLYRAWKTHITSNVLDGQIDFETWLTQKNKVCA